MTYNQAVSAALGISPDAALACRAYEIRHQLVFDAHRTILASRGQKDADVPSQQPQPIPQLP